MWWKVSEKKRFEFYSDDYLVGIIDTVTGKKLNHFATIDLLNELSDENGQLRKQVAEYDMILRQHEFAEKEGFR